MVLVVVLVVIAVLTLVSYTFSELMLTEHQATRVVARQAQARALAESGAELLRIFVSQTSDGIMQGGGTYDNTSQFQGMLVYDDGTTKGAAVLALWPRVLRTASSPACATAWKTNRHG